jgi:hypothetical protein
LKPKTATPVAEREPRFEVAGLRLKIDEPVRAGDAANLSLRLSNNPANCVELRASFLPRAQNQNAFVLVGVLLIVALATSLIVISTVLSRTERQAAANTASTEKARAQARLALDVALAHLQQTAGSDQRVTARAEILDSNAATEIVDGVNEPFWSGVWTTGNASLDVGGAASQRALSLGSTAPSAADISRTANWLVSGNNTLLDPRTFSATTT